MCIPRRHCDKVFLNSKLARIYEPHVAPLNRMVKRIQVEHVGVPFFDPGDGGVNARVLFLLEAPGPMAKDFVSCDNDDQTAENIFRLLHEAGLRRSEIVIWNVVPFYIGEPDRARLRAARMTDLDAGWPWVKELLAMLPSVDTVVLLGRPAQRAEAMIRKLRPDVCISPGWHPSPRCLNRISTRRQELLKVLKDAAKRPSSSC